MLVRLLPLFRGTSSRIHYSSFVRMSADEHLMFVYGTLKRDQPNNHFILKKDIGHAEFVASGKTVKKYPLVIAGSYNIPYLLYVPGQGHQVQGDIYRVDLKKRNFMDEFESHPTYYERMEDEIIVDDDSGSNPEPKTLRCWVYFMKNYKPDMLKLEAFPCYDTNGSHGLQYVESENTSDLSDV
ncbi:gamma-glutamylaminecyclotransferase-like isoform X2 [Littorina saxatilis]